MGFKARYSGTCARCGGTITVGSRIESAGRRYRHTGCTSPQQPTTSADDQEYATGYAEGARSGRGDYAISDNDLYLADRERATLAR